VPVHHVCDNLTVHHELNRAAHGTHRLRGQVNNHSIASHKATRSVTRPRCARTSLQVAERRSIGQPRALVDLLLRHDVLTAVNNARWLVLATAPGEPTLRV